MYEPEPIPLSDNPLVDWAREQLAAGDVTVRPMGRGDQSTVYVLAGASDRWFLKLSRNLGPERDRLEWAAGRITAPNVLGFRAGAERDALLTSAVPGQDLTALRHVWPGDTVAARLADALRLLHATQVADCPFVTGAETGVLVHGDACLPNVLFLENGDLSGFVDLGEMTVGNIEIDLSAAVWSLQYNLGPGFGLPFLRHYGLSTADEQMAERLRQMYEHRST
jgi:kanamycin kinase